jgi:ELWxxDGT repeat protein
VLRRFAPGSFPRFLPFQGGALFLAGEGPEGTLRLWASDGTPAGTAELLGFAPGSGRRLPLPAGSPILLAPLTPAFSIPLNLTPVGDRLLFAAQDPEHGTELWTTDGTSEGTHLLADLQPGAGSSNPQDFTAAGNLLFFSADDGTFGRELWESDGTPEGTRRVSDIAPGGFSSLFGFPFQPVASNGFLFFVADDGQTGLEPWALRLEP